MEKVDIKKKIHLALVALIFYIQKGTAFSTFPSALTSCASSTANIYFNFSIDANETIAGKRIWFFGADKIAESNETTLTPVPSYSSRLTAYGTSGISLSNITVADAGTYAYVVVLRPTLNPFTAITALSVQEAPLAPPSGCQVSSLNQPGNIPTCAVNTNSGNCGTPSLIAFLVNSTNTSSQFICNVGEIYQCCATSAALTCYSGSSNDFCKLFTCTDVTTTTTSTTTKETVTSTSTPSTSMPSTTINATTNSTSATHTATESTANASISTSSTNSATGSTASASSSTSASKSPTAESTFTATSTSKPTTLETIGSTSRSLTNNGSQGGTDTKVIVIAVVVPIGGLLLIVIIVLCIRYCWTGKKDHDIPDGMTARDRGNNVDGFKNDRTDKQLNAIPTISDDFIIYPGPAALPTSRPNKERKYRDVAYQYKTPYTGYQTAYVPSTYPSVKSSTHKDTKHHNIGHPYSRPYTGTYGNQTSYSHKNKSYDYESSYQIAASRPAYDQTAYYPQIRHYEHISQDVYQRGSGQYSYGQRSRPHQDHNGRQKQREYYYNQYEMADYGGSRT